MTTKQQQIVRLLSELPQTDQVQVLLTALHNIQISQDDPNMTPELHRLLVERSKSLRNGDVVGISYSQVHEELSQLLA